VNAALPEEGRRLVEEAATRGFPVRLLGGIAIWLAASERARSALGREYPDIDLVTHKQRSRMFRDMVEQLGYVPERVFNATHGAKRLLYHAADGSYHLDVFLGTFEMSHTLDFTDRLELQQLTVPAAELLLTKLQVAEVNRKDLSDAAMVLMDHELGDSDGPDRVNVAYLAALCANDWGLYTTVTDNLSKLDRRLEEFGLADHDRACVAARASAIGARLETAPKSWRWRLRSKIGRRMRWYETPEEVVR